MLKARGNEEFYRKCEEFCRKFDELTRQIYEWLNFSVL